MHLGTWNVQKLKNKPRGIIIKDLEEIKLDIITLMETKKVSGWETIDGFIHFYSGVFKEKRAKRDFDSLKEKSRSIID